MDKLQSHKIVKDTFQNQFNKDRFVFFIKNLLNSIDESKAFHAHGYVKHQYKQITKAVKTYERVGSYIDTDKKKIDILIVYLEKENFLDRARTTLRNFVADYLKQRDQKDAALIAFVSPNQEDWRFSLVKMDYKIENGKIKEEFTQAKRWSFLVGKNESCHTAQSRFAPIVSNDQNNPTLSELENAFNVETVSKEFYLKYRTLYENLVKELDSNKTFLKEAEKNNINTENFAKKLLGQIVFLYFLQKKGWLGATLDKKLNQGDKLFLKTLFIEAQAKGKNYFNDYLEFLFYDSLNKKPDRSADFYRSYFNCQIPFLNGGLFEPEYKWQDCSICLDNSVFSDILDTFDLFNFTVKEDEPLDKEVAVDPELLGRVFENLLPENLRKGKGTYYTPREIVHYMCQESLINFLDSNSKIGKNQAEKYVKFLKGDEKIKSIAAFEGEAVELDGLLENIKIVDPACGSGAFLVGMLQEIVHLRLLLRMLHPSKLKSKTESQLKKEAIRDCIYGVDIDPGAVEIAKLRLWLSLVVDYELKDIEPLPNLDYKIMQGNSLLEDLVIGDTTIKLTGLKNQSANNNMKNLFDKENQTDLFGEKETHNKIIEKLTKLHKEYFKLSDLEEKRRTKTEIEKLEYNLIEQNVNKELERLENQNKNLGKYLTSKAGFNQKDEKKFSKNLSQKTKIMNILEEYKNTGVKPFFLWQLYFADVFDDKKGFDVVIANPPYVRQEEINYKPALQKEYEIFNSVSDLYTYFYEKAFNILKNSGTLTFITSNKFLRARYGIFLRRYLKTNTSIKDIINFGDKHVFEAITNTLILIADKQKIENNIFNFSNSIDGLSKIVFSQGELQDSEWTIDNPEVISLKNKIEQRGIPLKEWPIRINRGLLTGYNEAYIINGAAKNELIKKEPKSKEIIKPIIRGRDIKRYYFVNSELYFIVTHNGYRSADKGIIPAIDIKKYPSIKNHLDKYIQQLKKRQDKGVTVYNLRDCAFMDDFAKEKIIWIELTNENKFAYSDKEDYLLAGAFFLVGKSLKYLLSFLNSKLCLFYFSLICNSSGMATTQWKKFALEKVPVPKLSEKDREPFVRVVDKILAITKSTDYLENPAKQAQVRVYENKIDQMVYKLYNLTKEEIKIVEEGKK